MDTHSDEKTYEVHEIDVRLKAELPRWTFEDGVIRRRFKTNGWKSTLMVVNAVGHLAEAAWHHPDIAATWGSVQVTLTTHSAGGITDKDFALARKIEQFVQWQPGREDAGLEGTPDDPRYKYIVYD